MFDSDENIPSLFTPAISKDAVVNDAAAGIAIPGSYKDVIVNLAPLKTECDEYSRIRIDFPGRFRLEA